MDAVFREEAVELSTHRAKRTGLYFDQGRPAHHVDDETLKRNLKTVTGFGYEFFELFVKSALVEGADVGSISIGGGDHLRKARGPVGTALRWVPSPWLHWTIVQYDLAMNSRPDVATQILTLWAVPRSTSTAFEWMMRQRGDMECVHEPFGEVWYQGETPDWPRLKADSVRTPGLTYESCWANLTTMANAGPLFIKEFPHYVTRLWTDEWLANFNHSFLIRNPAKTVTSMFKHWPDFVIEETAFAEQRILFDRLTELHGEPPPVIDSDDLLADPDSIVAKWCEAVGIDHIPEALSWEPGPRDEVSWWDGGSFHENLRNSNGLKPQAKTSINISEAPERVQAVVAELLPHYEHLRANRIQP